MSGELSDDLIARAASDPAAGFVLARRTFASDLWPEGAAETTLTFKKIAMAAANLKIGVHAMPGVVILIASLHSIWASWLVAAFWACVAILLWYISWHVFRRIEAKPGHAKSRSDIYLVLATTGSFALALNAQAIVFWSAENPAAQMSVLLILLALTVSAAMTAPWLPLSILQVVSNIGIAVGLLIGTGQGANAALAGMALLFGVFVVGMVANLHAYSLRLLTLEDHKDRLIADLRASNRAKSDFLANMSHELRTPMNAILGFSEVIKDEVLGPNHNAAYRDYAGDIHASGSHLLGLINDILDLAKIEAGRLELHESLVDAREIIEETRRILGLRAAQKGVSLVNDFPHGLLVWADPTAVRQISLNLGSNALKFTPKGGKILWRVDVVDDMPTFVIEDTGCGIRSEDLERVFESFGQGQHDLATKDKGTGLGLPIVRGLARAHGGDVTLESEVGKGTTVRVTLDPARIRQTPGKAGVHAA